MDPELHVLEEWEAAQRKKPTLFDVLATNRIDLFGAYVLRAFRRATALAVEERERVAEVRRIACEACGGDEPRAETLLRKPNELFGGDTPLSVAVSSKAGADRVIGWFRGAPNRRS